MNAQQIMNTLLNLLEEIGIPEDDLKPDSFLYQDLQLDSTEVVEVAVALKQKFGVRIKLEGRRDRTLSEVGDLVNSLMSEEFENVG